MTNDNSYEKPKGTFPAPGTLPAPLAKNMAQPFSAQWSHCASHTDWRSVGWSGPRSQDLDAQSKLKQFKFSRYLQVASLCSKTKTERNSRENEVKTGAKLKEELPKSEWIAFLFLSRLNRAFFDSMSYGVCDGGVAYFLKHGRCDFCIFVTFSEFGHLLRAIPRKTGTSTKIFPVDLWCMLSKWRPNKLRRLREKQCSNPFSQQATLKQGEGYWTFTEPGGER